MASRLEHSAQAWALGPGLGSKAPGACAKVQKDERVEKIMKIDRNGSSSVHPPTLVHPEPHGPQKYFPDLPRPRECIFDQKRSQILPLWGIGGTYTVEGINIETPRACKTDHKETTKHKLLHEAMSGKRSRRHLVCIFIAVTLPIFLCHCRVF